MSPDLVIGLVLVAVVTGVLLISLGFGRGEGRLNSGRAGRSDDGGTNIASLTTPTLFDGGGACSPGDGGGSCDGGGGGS